MLRQHAVTTAAADCSALGLRYAPQEPEGVLGRGGDQDLMAELEKRLQPRPVVADDRDAAGGCLEEPDAGRPAQPRQPGPGDVEREMLRVVEGAVVRRGQVLDVTDVARPPDVAWVEWPGDDHPAPAPPAGRVQPPPFPRP